MDIPVSNTTSFSPQDKGSFHHVVDIMATLRGPDGCPWDREQTSESLKPYLLEEVYEVLEAIDAQDPLALKEELGDLLLQILFHSQIASEEDQFSFEDVKTALGKKLVRRHPHVFHQQDKDSPTTSADVIRRWEEIKQQEKTQKQISQSVVASVPKIAPALQRAHQIQKRASQVGFDWNSIQPVIDKFKEELGELYDATIKVADPVNVKDSLKALPVDSDMEVEFGDVLFSLVNISRFLHINPEEALRKSTNKFIKRFQYVESQALEQGKQLKDFPPEQLEQWWDRAKNQEAASPQPSQNKEPPRP